MFESEVSVELLVHYLAPLPDPDLLLGPGGEDYNIRSAQHLNIIAILFSSFQFEAQPRPDEVTWFIQGDSETVIPVSPKEQRVIQNYVVYPLHQVSQFVWRATLTILEVTAEENYKDHYIVVSSRFHLYFTEIRFLTYSSDSIKTLSRSRSGKISTSSWLD